MSGSSFLSHAARRSPPPPAASLQDSPGLCCRPWSTFGWSTSSYRICFCLSSCRGALPRPPAPRRRTHSRRRRRHGTADWHLIRLAGLDPFPCAAHSPPRLTPLFMYIISVYLGDDNDMLVFLLRLLFNGWDASPWGPQEQGWRGTQQAPLSPQHCNKKFTTQMNKLLNTMYTETINTVTTFTKQSVFISNTSYSILQVSTADVCSGK